EIIIRAFEYDRTGVQAAFVLWLLRKEEPRLAARLENALTTRVRTQLSRLSGDIRAHASLAIASTLIASDAGCARMNVSSIISEPARLSPSELGLINYFYQVLFD